MDEQEKARHFRNAQSNFGGISEEEFVFQCTDCKHYQGANICAAFPDGFPLEIADESFIHTRLHPDQKNTIVYEKK